MVKLNKYSYQLNTKSRLILSPRQQEAFYQEIDYTKQDSDKNIIYPFYRRGDYQKLREENIAYYIPSSAIKGSLLTKNQKRTELSNVLVMDDIELTSEDICIDQVTKVQYASLETEKQMKLESFFENVAVEMCNADTKKRGYVFCEEELTSYFEECHKQTITKLKQWSNKIEELLKEKKEIDGKTVLKLKQAVNNIKSMTDTDSIDSNAYLMLLGGYKGLLLSLVVEGETAPEIESGFFIDPTTELPYGLVEISQVKSNE